MLEIEKEYRLAVDRPSDINEHVPTLEYYAAQCRSVVEFGVRSGVGTRGIIRGISLAALANPSSSFTVDGYDLSPAPDVYRHRTLVGIPNVTLSFTQANVLHIPPVHCDLLFIDTMHVFGQLRRELALHATGVRRYIIMHDTTVDAQDGELIRRSIFVENVARDTKMPASELIIGLWPAVEMFLASHVDTWVLESRYTNNNGLTVLRRVQQ